MEIAISKVFEELSNMDRDLLIEEFKNRLTGDVASILEELECKFDDNMLNTF